MSLILTRLSKRYLNRKISEQQMFITGNNYRAEKCRLSVLKWKITYIEEIPLRCVDWNRRDGWIAIGGDGGLLKVIRLDHDVAGHTGTSSVISASRILDGHTGRVQMVAWNPVYQRLTSSDEDGLLILWAPYKGIWYEDILSKRMNAKVLSMAWDNDGRKICILYEDGVVIVGSWNGKRIWGKRLINCRPVKVTWSPQGKMLLIGMISGEVLAYTGHKGVFLSRIKTPHCQERGYLNSSGVMGISWCGRRHDNPHFECPTLAIIYRKGQLLLLKNRTDPAPLIVETNILGTGCAWNRDGSVLAVSGKLHSENEESKDFIHMLQLYSPLGQHLCTVKLPGKQLTGFAWDETSREIVLSVDSTIYFATVHADYKWCSFGSCYLAYSFTRPDSDLKYVLFWNMDTNESCTKEVNGLVDMVGAGDHCILVSQVEKTEEHCLLLCNEIGKTVDSRLVNISALHLTANSSQVFVANQQAFVMWPFHTTKTRAAAKCSWERHLFFHIDNDEASNQKYDNLGQLNQKDTTDLICVLAAGEEALLVGRESGLLHYYSLPQIKLLQKFQLPARPRVLAVNCNSMRASVVDVTGLLSMVHLNRFEGKVKLDEEILRAKCKDVWDICWAEDDPTLLAVMAKTRVQVFSDTSLEEPIAKALDFCSFRQLEIRGVLLHEVVGSINPENPSLEFVVRLESQKLREARALLANSGLAALAAALKKKPHLRLWRLLTEASLEEMDLHWAEVGMVGCKDWLGINFIRNLGTVHGKNLRRAEVAIYYGRFKEAERLYLKDNRQDLLMDMLAQMGEWEEVLHMLYTAYRSPAQQFLIKKTLIHLGDQHAQFYDWESAKECFDQARDLERLVQCYYQLDDTEGMESMMASLTVNHPLLALLGNTFASVGLCEEAVQSFLKCGMPHDAMNACITLNHWQRAIELAKIHQLPQVNGLLERYALELLEIPAKKLQVVELYRKANHFMKAAKLMYQLAEEEAKRKPGPMYMKKLYVMAALLVEEQRKVPGGVEGVGIVPTLPSSTSSRTVTTNVAVTGDDAGAMADASAGASANVTCNMAMMGHFDNPWRGAEAYHFFMLAQEQMYKGLFDASMKTASQLWRYDDILSTEKVYSILALSSCINRSYEVCSKAMMRLESLGSSIAPWRLKAYEDLGLEIFIKQAPRDARPNGFRCDTCEYMVPDGTTNCPYCNTYFPTCVASGQPLKNLDECWACPRCHHWSSYQDMASRSTCPLCHQPVCQWSSSPY